MIDHPTLMIDQRKPLKKRIIRELTKAEFLHREDIMALFLQQHVVSKDHTKTATTAAATSTNPWSIGQVVEVASRTWPG